MRTALALALLVALALVAPVATAADGVDLAAGESAVSGSAPSGPATVSLPFHLQLDRAMALRLNSAARSGGQALAHQADWTLGAGVSTSDQASGETGTLAAGAHDFGVTFTLPATADSPAVRSTPSAAVATGATRARATRSARARAVRMAGPRVGGQRG